MKIVIAAAAMILVAGCADADDKPILWHETAGQVLPATGSVDPAVPCQAMSISLVNGSAVLFKDKPQPCKPVSISHADLRHTLFIEGLDEKGARLFVAMGPNTSHADGPGGDGVEVHSLLTTQVRAPVTPALVKLRWYDVDAKFQPHLLGEVDWSVLNR